MAHTSFASWLISEKSDIFGFERRRREVEDKRKSAPIDPLNSETVMAELSRHSVNVRPARRDWSHVVEWGQGTGSLKVVISPLGSYKAIVRRLVEDLEGTPVWVCKKVIPFQETGYDHDEIAIASDIHRYLEEADREMAERPSHDFKDVERLVLSLAAKIRQDAPPLFMFGGVRKVEENFYIIHLDVCGHGVEAPGATRLEQFNVNVSYDAARGLLRCWGNDVSSPTNQHLWQLQPSEWDEYFAPSQPRDEIEGAITAALSTY